MCANNHSRYRLNKTCRWRIKENSKCSNSNCKIRYIPTLIKIVNFIKSRTLRAIIFFIICKDMESLLCHLLRISVRWLSRVKVLVRVFGLWKQLLTFFEENQFSLSCRLREPKYLQCLACMAYIFLKLNDFNLSLQGKCTSVLSVKEKITAIKRKLKIWCKNVNIDDLTLLQNFLNLTSLCCKIFSRIIFPY